MPRPNISKQTHVKEQENLTLQGPERRMKRCNGSPSGMRINDYRMQSLISSLEHLGCFTPERRLELRNLVPILSSDELESELSIIGVPGAVLEVARSHYGWNICTLASDLISSRFLDT